MPVVKVMIIAAVAFQGRGGPLQPEGE